MLPNISGGHTAYQNFVVTNLRKYYPNPDALAPSTWDIIERFWNSDNSHLSSHIHPIKEKVKKPKTKGTKADSMEKVTVAQLLPQLENTKFHIDDQPYSSLFKIYKNEFLDVSVSKGLIDTSSLALAGDGTPVVTSHRERKKRICNCAEEQTSRLLLT